MHKLRSILDKDGKAHLPRPTRLTRLGEPPPLRCAVAVLIDKRELQRHPGVGVLGTLGVSWSAMQASASGVVALVVKKCMRYGLGNHSCRRHSSFPSLEFVTTSSLSRDLAYHVHPSPWQPYRTSGYMYASTCCAIVPKNGIKNSNTNTTSLATSPSSRCMSIPHMWLSSGAVGS